jgi:ribosomal protein L17
MKTTAGRKLSRTTSHRRATLNALATQILLREQVVTTYPKAREAARLTDSLISRVRRGGRQAFPKVVQHVSDIEVRKKLFETIAPRYQDRVGGFVRVIRIGNRRGDGAEMAVAKLV